MRTSARTVSDTAPSSRPSAPALAFAVVAAALTAAMPAASPVRAGEAVLTPAPSPDVVIPAPPSAAATSDVTPPDTAPARGTDPAPLVSSDAEGAEETEVPPFADPAPALEGPLRPKGDGPSIAAGGHEDGWTRTFDRGVRWSKGDTSLGISGAPGVGVRIGATISR